MKVVNLTNHTVSFLFNGQLTKIAPSGKDSRQELPEPETDTVYLVYDEVIRQNPNRTDLKTPYGLVMSHRMQKMPDGKYQYTGISWTNGGRVFV